MRQILFATCVAIGLGVACHHDPAIVMERGEKPPLPPSSGTPVGYIVDDATALELRGDQITQLKDIDTGLSARLEVLDTRLRGLDKEAQDAATNRQSAANARGGGGRHGGGGAGGMGGGAGSFGGGPPGGAGGGGKHHRGGGQGSDSGSGASAGARGDAVGKLTEERAHEVRDALQRALAVLDQTQRVAAMKLLTDHGIDVDTGRETGGSDASDASGGHPPDWEP